jgi:hypothetical protein
MHMLHSCNVHTTFVGTKIGVLLFAGAWHLFRVSTTVWNPQKSHAQTTVCTQPPCITCKYHICVHPHSSHEDTTFACIPILHMQIPHLHAAPSITSVTTFACIPIHHFSYHICMQPHPSLELPHLHAAPILHMQRYHICMHCHWPHTRAISPNAPYRISADTIACICTYQAPHSTRDLSSP